MNNSRSTQTPNYKALVANAILQIEALKSELEAIKNPKKEPIAIIGMSCRLPGGVDSPEAFWQLLNQGIDAISEVPQQRWNIDEYYDPNPDTPGKIITRYGGFLSQVDQFDAPFFGISSREAKSLDPQQRLLLEVSWEAIERANLLPEKLFNTQTGVFIGIGNSDYSGQLAHSSTPEAYWGTGCALSVAAGRLSYLFGLKGPSLSVDTACSSSLVSVHLACQSLRNQESELALAGGVNLLLSPDNSIVFSQAQMLSPDGKCKTFDADANGYVRAEGCGVMVLKRLSDAVAHGDNILAVIRGSAINQDGASGGLTIPNGPSQQAVIRQALENGGVDPASVSYIEAHGTGTSLGDPIEVGAVGKVFKKTHTQDQPIIMGSVKTNIGHLEGAAGIAGLMKVVLQLQHQQIVPSLHFHQPNPYINWEELPVEISTQISSWPGNGLTRVAGVSSFAFSGTNAHVVLEETPMQLLLQNQHSQKPASMRRSEDNIERSVHILTLSGKTEGAVSDLVNSYQNYLQAGKNERELADICYTANTSRSQFNCRLAVIASNRQELVEKLQHYKPGESVSGIYSGKVKNNQIASKVALLFTGQGSQYVNMGRQLYETAPVFRTAMNQCDEILTSELEESLLKILYQDDNSSASLINQTAYTQPALFALEYSLYQLWKSWGIKPGVVMGHSVGEYVAAAIAEIFSLEDGLKLIAKRGRLIQELPPGGEMFAVMTSESIVQTLIAPYPEIAIAAINGPESVVISGESVAIKTIVSNLEAEGIKTKQLGVSHAFHSPLMEPMLTEFAAVAEGLTYSQPQIPVVSNLTGTLADNSITQAQYWVNHLRQPVKFAQGMKTLYQEGAEVFLEIGPKPILLGMGRQCLPDDVGVWLPSLRSGVNEWQQMLSSLGQLYVKGARVDWIGFDRDYARQKVTLPTYPFQRQRYWVKKAIIDYSDNGKVSMFSSKDKTNIQNLINYLKTTGKFSDLELQLFDKMQVVLENNSINQVEDLEENKIDSEFIHILEKASQRERKPLLINYLQNQIAAVIEWQNSQLPDPEIGFFEMGMDSLMAVELKKRLEKTLLVSLPETLSFNYPNISALSSYILEDLLGYNETENKDIKQTVNQNTAIDNLSQLEDLSEDEVEDSILKEITDIEKLLQ